MKEKDVKKFVNALISGQVALHYFEELKHTPFYQKATKNKLNLVLNELQKNETVFEIIQDEAESATDDVHDSFFEFIDMIIGVPFQESGNVTKILEAYKKDPKRMYQITKKILEQ